MAAVDFTSSPTTTSTYDDVYYTAIITDEVLDALMATVVSPQFMRVADLSGEASKAAKFPKADKFTAAAVSEGSELSNTALTTGSVTLTAAEIGIQATITDVLELSDIPAAHGARLRQLGRALGDKVDVDICALLAGFTNAVGSTGVDMSLDNILDAIYTLEAADAAGLGELVFLGHPRQIGDLRVALKANQPASSSGTAAAGSGIYFGPGDTGKLSKSEAGYFGEWFGVKFYQSTNVPTANAAADRAGGVFVRDYALGMVKKWDAKVETLRWPPIRGWVLVATAMYGVGEIEDSAGVEVTTDA